MLIEKGDTFSVLGSSQIGEIRDFLRQNIHIPEKPEEISCLYVYLHFLSGSKYISFPLNVLKSESPDFVLNTKIGLEVVKSSTQKENHAWALMEKEYPQGSLLEMPDYAPDSTGDVRKGIRKPGERLQSEGFGDFGMENAWLECIYDRLCKKASLLNKKHFSKYQSNQLIVYDDTGYFTDLDYVLPRLQNKYKPVAEFHFDQVHIVRVLNKVNDNHLFIADVFGECARYDIPPDFI
jgi:hypothetical protein